MLLNVLPNYCVLSDYQLERTAQAGRQYAHRYTRLSCSKLSQDQVLICVIKCCLAGKNTNGSHCSSFVQHICMVMVLLSTQRSCKNWQRSVYTSGRGEKLQFPSVILAPWNAGIVLVTAGFQSTLKCNWTLKRQTEKGRHCQGQSLARHAIATSCLIDLYKAIPRCHSVSLI